MYNDIYGTPKKFYFIHNYKYITRIYKKFIINIKMYIFLW